MSKFKKVMTAIASVIIWIVVSLILFYPLVLWMIKSATVSETMVVAYALMGCIWVDYRWAIMIKEYFYDKLINK